VIAVVGGGVVFCAFYCYRLAAKHNDVTVNKKKPFQFRTHGGTPKFVHTHSWTKPNLKFNAETGKWE